LGQPHYTGGGGHCTLVAYLQKILQRPQIEWYRVLSH